MGYPMKKYWQRVACFILAFCLTPLFAFLMFRMAYADEGHFDGDAEIYYQELLDAGFPDDYAHSLTELHLLHPEWTFDPLFVTEGNSLYSWDYVIEQETKDPETNLIAGSEDYRVYRHLLNFETYDSGYYQASKAAVEYFMDPRNFLNETDIFQFYDLSLSHSVEIDAVEAVLAGTFMEDGILENGKTFAENFIEVGQALDISPVYLAVKARQEQGTQGYSPVLGGECGSLLADYYQNGTQTSPDGNKILAPTQGYTLEELQSLDGYYNLFNIKANGNGLFTIYYNAMKRAQSGTDAMAEEWGSPAWNTLWKSMWGGAYTIKASFIDRYQNTIYLQKFNVDSRAADRNFWGQYMQNVAGSLTESRTLFSAFAASGVLDGPCSFQIPVYEGMPKNACKDPAGGSCSYLAQATEKYESPVFFSLPFLLANKNTVYQQFARFYDQEIHLRGLVDHSYGVDRIEYRWDDGAWQTLCEGDKFDVTLTLPQDFEIDSTHMLILRTIADYDHDNSLKKSNWSVLSAVFYVTIHERPDIHISIENNDNITTATHKAGTKFTLPVCQEENFVGWYGSDNTLMPSGGIVTPEEDITYTALYMRFEAMRGAALVFLDDETHLRFYTAAEAETLKKISQTDASITFFATVINEDGIEQSSAVSFVGYDESFDTTWQVLSADTEALVEETYNTDYSMRFWALCTYSDGSVQASSPDGIYSIRSAARVASAALADTAIQYESDIVERLKKIVSVLTA